MTDEKCICLTVIILLGCIAFINRTRYHHTQKDIDTIERAEAEQPPVKGTLADGLTDSHEEKVDSDFYNAPPSMTIPSSNFGPARSLTLDAAPRFTAALVSLTDNRDDAHYQIKPPK